MNRDTRMLPEPEAQSHARTYIIKPRLIFGRWWLVITDLTHIIVRHDGPFDSYDHALAGEGLLRQDSSYGKEQ